MSDLVMYLITPIGIRYWWNLGSLLGIIIVIQILTGWLLTLFYVRRWQLSFDSVWLIHLERWNGNLVHLIHLNFASFIFLVLYFHMLKGVYYQSWKTNKLVWVTGLILMVLIMAVAFLGYVLPTGQMSLWGATVITNLISVIRKKLVIWIWGGYSVNQMTLGFFYTLHYILPFVVLFVVIAHLIVLHIFGRTTFGLKTHFWPYFAVKDIMNVIVLLFFVWWTLKYSYYTSDPDNFIKANPSVSPLHIKPEWYFLQYYAILRSIPNKVVGVVFFALSLLIFGLLVLNKGLFSRYWFPVWRLRVSTFVRINLLLIMVGGKPVEYPFLELGQVLTFLYFVWFLGVIYTPSVFD